MTTQENPELGELSELFEFFVCNRLPDSRRCLNKRRQEECPGRCDGGCRSRRSLAFMSEVKALYRRNLTGVLQNMQGV